jgi:hypothetical protein
MDTAGKTSREITEMAHNWIENKVEEIDRNNGFTQ